ncbi:BUD13 homolog [Alexandromys fortis]|uniref:BUD13 homolog n=1 Tax=Alexandromys fortis TaxID=100897 RepID=UPI002153A667|nr:BUD13 homolog [Microtus fortis]
MAAAPPVSKAEYLKRYLSGADAGLEGGSESVRKRRKKRPKPGGAAGKGMRIVDDDVGWAAISTTKPEKEEEEDGDLPVVAEFVDERPEEVKQMEAFRSSAKWKLLGDHSEDGHFRHDEQDPSSPRRVRHDTPDPSSRRSRHDTPDPSPPRKTHHDTPDPSPPRRARHDTPDPSPPRRSRHDTPDPSPPRRSRHDTPDPSPPRRSRHDTPDPSPPRRSRHDADTSPPRRVRHDSDASPPRKSHRNSSGVSPRRGHPGSSGVSPPRRAHNHSPDTATHRRTFDTSDPQPLRRARHDSPDLELSRTKSSKAAERSSSKTVHQRGLGPSHSSLSKNSKYGQDSDLSPRKRQAKAHVGAKKQLDPKGEHMAVCSLAQTVHVYSCSLAQTAHMYSSSLAQTAHMYFCSLAQTARMYSGAKTGLVTDVQREQQDLKKQDQDTTALGAQFEFAETVFRDKSGRKRNLKLERLEQRRKAEKDSERDELYAQWGKGLAQSRQQQQNVEDAMKEMQKPLARYIDDEDLDRMLREQEREGDPMANFIKKNKAKENKHKKVRPRYNGPAPPPNRFNIWPGYRWDGVDRSNGFEQKRFARLASKKAVEELAYKWSVEDM